MIENWPWVLTQKVDITLCPNVFPLSGFPETVAPDVAEGWDGCRGGSKLVAPKTVNPAPCKPCWQKMELRSSFITILNRSHCCVVITEFSEFGPLLWQAKLRRSWLLSASTCHSGEPNSVSLWCFTLFSPWILRIQIFGRNPLEWAHWHEIKDTQWPDRLESLIVETFPLCMVHYEEWSFI